MNSLTTAEVAISGQNHLKLQNYDIICISVMDWDWPFPTSRHNLMREFARANRVLFVDPPLHYLSDYRATFRDTWLRQKLKRGLGGDLIQREENLYSFTPPPVAPFNRLPRNLLRPVLKANGLLFRQAVRKAARRLGMQRPILWISFNPYFGIAVCGALNQQLTLYHCTDDVARFPGYSSHIIEVERRLMQRSDLVITTSSVLLENKKQYNPKTFFVPNGANVNLFRQALDDSLPLPPDLASIPEPRVGFTGQMEFRFDTALMLEVVRRRPELSFVLIGGEDANSSDLARLHALPNVYFLGNKPQVELPHYLRGMKAAIIPYKNNDLTRSIYPLKLHEYFAAGRAVVATPLPSLTPFQDLALIAADADEFVAALDRVINESEDQDIRQRRLAVAEQHSWEKVAGKISGLLAESLTAKKSAIAGT
jgi:hypothetical protein